jgi:hypothetical protein
VPNDVGVTSLVSTAVLTQSTTTLTTYALFSEVKQVTAKIEMGEMTNFAEVVYENNQATDSYLQTASQPNMPDNTEAVKFSEMLEMSTAHEIMYEMTTHDEMTSAAEMTTADEMTTSDEMTTRDEMTTPDEMTTGAEMIYEKMSLTDSYGEPLSIRHQRDNDESVTLREMGQVPTGGGNVGSKINMPCYFKTARFISYNLLLICIKLKAKLFYYQTKF